MSDKSTRREMLGSFALGAAAVAALNDHSDGADPAKPKVVQDEKYTSVDALSAPTRVDTNWSKLDKLNEKVPLAEFCGLKVSRLAFGGGPMLGHAHCRDLRFVRSLVAAYHTVPKCYATLKMAEACGINTILMNPSGCKLLRDYWEKQDGTIQAITYCYGMTEEPLIERITHSIEHDVSACLIQGQVADHLMKKGDTKTVVKCLDLIRKAGIPAGICAHSISTFKACVEKGIVPDFWMKTFHHHNYWSFAKGLPECDNVFCHDPEETIEFMEGRSEPWIAFKILAAGAIPPANGMKWALENGADIIALGMHDFEIVDDVNMFTNVMKGELKRKRPWCAKNA